MVQLSHLYMTTGKTIALTILTILAEWCLCFLISCLLNELAPPLCEVQGFSTCSFLVFLNQHQQFNHTRVSVNPNVRLIKGNFLQFSGIPSPLQLPSLCFSNPVCLSSSGPTQKFYQVLFRFPSFWDDLGTFSRLYPGEGNGNPLQYTCLENSMDRGAWRATVHGVAKSRM